MKKHTIMLFTAMILVLGACASNNDDNNSNNGANDNTNTEENQNQGTNDENADNSENNAEDNEENGTDNNVENNAGNNMDHQANNDSADSNSALAGFPEYETLVEEIDVDRLDAEIETDNSNKRVILYADSNEHKQYKSIFIKKQDRLKIIHFDDDGEIFNEVIK